MEIKMDVIKNFSEKEYHIFNYNYTEYNRKLKDLELNPDKNREEIKKTKDLKNKSVVQFQKNLNEVADSMISQQMPIIMLINNQDNSINKEDITFAFTIILENINLLPWNKRDDITTLFNSCYKNKQEEKLKIFAKLPDESKLSLAKTNYSNMQDTIRYYITKNNLFGLDKCAKAFKNLFKNKDIKKSNGYNDEFIRFFEGMIGDGTIKSEIFFLTTPLFGKLFVAARTNTNISNTDNKEFSDKELGDIALKAFGTKFEKVPQQIETSTHTQTLNNVNGALDNINDVITQQEAQVEQSNNAQQGQQTDTQAVQQTPTAVQQQEQLNNTSNNLANASGELPTTLVEELSNRAGKNNKNATTLWENIRNNENIEWLSEFGGQNLSREDKDEIKDIFENVPGFNIIVFNAKLNAINREKGK